MRLMHTLLSLPWRRRTVQLRRYENCQTSRISMRGEEILFKIPGCNCRFCSWLNNDKHTGDKQETDTMKKQKAVTEQAGSPHPDTSGAAPGYLLMPESLTAENGAKALLTGVFEEIVKIECWSCDWDGDEECEICAGHGSLTYRVPVSWTTIKAIYRMTVKHLAR